MSVNAQVSATVEIAPSACSGAVGSCIHRLRFDGRKGPNEVPGVIGGMLAVLAGIAVLVVRCRRRDRLIAFMPLVPIGYGLVVASALMTLQASPGWIAAVLIGAIILASRKVPLVLLWTGRISRQQAALLSTRRSSRSRSW